jgi:hypothetical protein
MKNKVYSKKRAGTSLKTVRVKSKKVRASRRMNMEIMDVTTCQNIHYEDMISILIFLTWGRLPFHVVYDRTDKRLLTVADLCTKYNNQIESYQNLYKENDKIYMNLIVPIQTAYSKIKSYIVSPFQSFFSSVTMLTFFSSLADGMFSYLGISFSLVSKLSGLLPKRIQALEPLIKTFINGFTGNIMLFDPKSEGTFFVKTMMYVAIFVFCVSGGCKYITFGRYFT